MVEIKIKLNPNRIGKYDKWCAVLDRDENLEITIAPTQYQCAAAARIYARRVGGRLSIYGLRGYRLSSRQYPKPE